MSMYDDLQKVKEKVERIVLEHTTDGHYKFYHISKQQGGYLAEWGRIGNRPQSKFYEVSGMPDIQKWVSLSMCIQMEAKLDKGYVLKTYKLEGDHSTGYEQFMKWAADNGTKLELFGEELV